MAHPLCRAAINRRVTGDPNEWPLEWFSRKFGPRRVALSLGCGIGNLERAALKIGLCATITGIDFSSESIRIARERARAAGYADRLTYEVADLNQLRLPKSTYDVVFIHQALHHVASLEKLLARVAASATDNGLLFLDEWTGPSMTKWSPALLARAAGLYRELPRAWRRWPELPLPVSAHDPSEGIRSSEILPTLMLFFEPLETRPYGGHLAAPVMSQLDPTVDPGPPLDVAIERWLTLEEQDLVESPDSGYHHVVVARRRRGAPALLGRLIGVTRRMRMAVRYRMAAGWNSMRHAFRVR
jgi:SAM-dependent methyltransferase